MGIARKVTKEQQKEFWKHKIHPITGFTLYNERYTKSDAKEKRELKKREKLVTLNN